ncbi:MAG: relaxase/mobilization nuclease domain-containing protein [Lachnospiraceae bacterium]|nr:relaxase/mobilization nuclease domain-containing protein [Lachnospiraceae bacterium]MCH4065066.1 relaxase/mobilization nuclease domain-containing protein [Lachnospiraceae bacterium]MCH4104042.1 relaxase/mobilization nuclease domain-containing protein [Lachnospiraceae bacterium]
MAATRLIALHVNKSKGASASMHERLEYSQNPEKTEDGELITAYACQPETTAEEFLLARRQYQEITGREYRGDIIAYQIRQSFKPGEITPEDANKIGYELAMRFTKGRHAFTVSTHTDKTHIHNHIIFNSIDLDHTHKFKNFFFSGIALQRLSDILCFEHGYSIIQRKPYAERNKRTVYPKRHTIRSELEAVITEVLKKKPKDLETFLDLLRQEGYEIKRGKHIAVKGRAQKRFIRLDSLHVGFRTQDLIQILENAQKGTSVQHTPGKRQKIDLLIDLQEKIQQGKGAGYQRWAKVFNLKQMAKVLLFLQENGIHDYEQLERLAKEAAAQTDHLLSDIKQKEERMQEIRELRMHIINYSKTRDIYTAYRKARYSRNFFEVHREEITLHKAAKDAFDQLGLKKIPRVAELNEEFSRLAKEKNAEYAQYRTARERMRDLANARRNAEMILKEQGENVESKDRKQIK